MELIQSVALTSGTTQINLTSIPQTYKHLYLSAHFNITTAPGSLALRFNNQSTGDYFSHFRYNSSISRYTNQTQMRFGELSTNDENSFWMNISDYTNTNKYPTLYFEQQRGFGYSSGLNMTSHWGGGFAKFTSAISQINLFTTNNGTFNSPTVVNLYGVEG